jgi:hypothetical protein
VAHRVPVHHDLAYMHKDEPRLKSAMHEVQMRPVAGPEAHRGEGE